MMNEERAKLVLITMKPKTSKRWYRRKMAKFRKRYHAALRSFAAVIKDASRAKLEGRSGD